MKALKKALFDKGVDIVRCIDISELPLELTQGYSKAIVFCMALSKQFIKDMQSGVSVPLEQDDYLEKEKMVNDLADWVAEYIQQRGYNAYSQSENNNLHTGHYDDKTKTSSLPHKTIARLAGLGFIGKNNLLVTEAYGCGFCMCTVLTDAPYEVEQYVQMPIKCGGCDICKNSCPAEAIHGKGWTENGTREDIVDVFRCKCALKCMVNCPWTLKYVGVENR